MSRRPPSSTLDRSSAASDVYKRQRLKGGMRAVVERYRSGVRLTPNHDILLTDVPPAHKPGVQALLLEHGVDVRAPLRNVQLYSMACVALPTCGLAAVSYTHLRAHATVPPFGCRLLL